MCEIPHIAVMRGRATPRTPTMSREPLVVPQAPRERVDDRPPPHALAVEVEGLAQAVDAAADPRARDAGRRRAPGGGRGAARRRRRRARRRAAWGRSRATARARRAGRCRRGGPGAGGPRRRPSAPARAARRSSRRRGRAARGRTGRPWRSQRAGSSSAQRRASPASVRNGVARRRRRGPEAPEHGGGLPVGLRLVGDAPQLIARRAALDEQRAARRVRCEQPDRAGAVPVGQRRRLVLALGLGEVDLEHGGRAVRRG